MAIDANRTTPNQMLITEQTLNEMLRGERTDKKEDLTELGQGAAALEHIFGPSQTNIDSGLE